MSNDFNNAINETFSKVLNKELNTLQKKVARKTRLSQFLTICLLATFVGWGYQTFTYEMEIRSDKAKTVELNELANNLEKEFEVLKAEVQMAKAQKEKALFEKEELKKENERLTFSIESLLEMTDVLAEDKNEIQEKYQELYEEVSLSAKVKRTYEDYKVAAKESAKKGIEAANNLWDKVAGK